MKKSLTYYSWIFLTMLLTIFALSPLFAQESNNDFPPIDNYEEEFELCGADYVNQDSEWEETYLNMMKEMDEDASSRLPTIITIPVVMHIVHNGEAIGTGRNISNAQIQSFIDVLNEDFRKLNSTIATIIPPFANAAADCEIEFCLAVQDQNGNVTTGINRYHYGQPSWGYEISNIVQTATVWDRNNYMNVWVADLGNINAIGFARYPGGNPLLDGIVMDFRVTGRSPQNPFINYYNGRFSLGHVGTHEVGHWLGLPHTFNNGCGNQLFCYATGDYVCDTPPKATPTWGCNLWVYQCSNNGLTMVQNFMDYADDQCTALFTNGQKTLMRNVLAGIRSSILTSPGCQPVCDTPQNLAANNVTNTTATLAWGAVNNAVTYNVQYRKFAGGPFPWTNAASNTNALNINNLTAFTPYEFRVQTVCNGTTSAWSQPFLFWTLSNQFNCGNDVWENAVFYPPMQNNVPTYGLICPLGDVDFQLIQVQIPNSTISVTLDQLPADYDLEMKDAAGTILAGSYTAGGVPETITYANAQPGFYYPTIMSNAGQWHPALYFRLTSVVTPPPPLKSSTSSVRLDDFMITDLRIYPNPAQDRFTLTFNNLSDEKVLDLKILDILGRTVKQVNNSVDAGFNQLEIDISDLENGNYFIQSMAGNIIREGTQLIIQK